MGSVLQIDVQYYLHVHGRLSFYCLYTSVAMILLGSCMLTILQCMAAVLGPHTGCMLVRMSPCILPELTSTARQMHFEFESLSSFHPKDCSSAAAACLWHQTLLRQGMP